MASQGVIGERTGPNAKLGERGASKGASRGRACLVPITVGNRNMLLEISARTHQLSVTTAVAASATTAVYCCTWRVLA